jgi:hypothetical protein
MMWKSAWQKARRAFSWFSKSPTDPNSKFLLWKKVLYEAKPYSVYWQLQEMLWNDAVFQIVNATRAKSPIHGDSKVEVNPLIHHFINQSYSGSQLIAIRRLVDKNPIEGPRAVYSLLSAIKDMKKHRSLFTRRNIFDTAGLDYDAPEKLRAIHTIRAQNPPRQAIYLSQEETKLHQALHLHGEIDRLTGTLPGKGKETDTIPKEIFSGLLNRLNDRSINSLTDYVNRFIAHASLKTLNPDEITRNKIRKAHEILCRTYNYVADNLLYGIPRFELATAIFDLFEHIENPMVRPDQKKVLRQMWDENQAEIQSWKSWNN